MGKSSSGKDTVYKKLKEQYKEFRLIVPYTTRPIREGEKDGVEYYFVDPEQFRAMKEDGKVIESRSYNTKCGIWTYFTADDGQIDLSAADYLLIGTLVSYQALREYFGEEAIVPVYLEVEDGLRLARALERRGDAVGLSVAVLGALPAAARSTAQQVALAIRVAHRKVRIGQGSLKRQVRVGAAGMIRVASH